MSSAQQMVSRLGFILAVAGAAVGLGNIWRFPYMAGEHGGSVFLLFYLLFVFLLGVPAMAAEILIGRAGRATPATSLRQLASTYGGSRRWSWVAGVGMLAAAMVLSFYSVVSGWGGYYFIESLKGSLNGLNSQGLGQFFDTFLGNPLLLIVFNTVFLIMTLTVNGRPVAKGLEKLNYLLMPLLYGLLILLVFYASHLPGFQQALNYLFSPSWEQISGQVLVEAMGHAFFTLAVGACCLMAYGAYMPGKQSIPKAISVVVLLDLLVSILTGIAIFSVVFSNGVDPSSGPGLMFITLPGALNAMPMGDIVLPVFFCLFIIATWTSSINLAEPLVASTARYFSLSRSKASFAVGCVIWLLGLIPVFSFNEWKDIHVAGHGLFDLWTGVATNILLPLTGFLVLVFVGWVLPKTAVMEQLGSAEDSIKSHYWMILFRYGAPGMVLIIGIAGLITT
ncbi:sodium-dependent transporter [Sansalvadorimonas verongulae]|uniref:sodium-dependent transporter n=1 Tax=Sansalvadorimonas verongulae TaxID=2172824 RepID=UPI0012BC6214|nr:sodium-dependent transporter [Sansalvadorimonas verongulae]MTI14292.1 sodium-dependent transporter [Sansalvadorimonas verongulae]